MSTSPRAIPAIPAWEPTNQWLTVAEYARIMKRSARTIHHWCETGVLKDFNIPHFQEQNGLRRWWIKHIP